MVKSKVYLQWHKVCGGNGDSPMRVWARASARAEGWEWEWGGWAGAGGGGGGTCWDWGCGAWVGRDSPCERVEEAEEEVEEPCRELLIQVSGDCWSPALSLDTASSSEEDEESDNYPNNYPNNSKCSCHNTKISILATFHNFCYQI